MFENLSDFDFDLPNDRIARSPMTPRDHSQLMVLDRQTQNIQHKRFFEITEFLRAGDLLVLNDSQVFPARLYATKETGGRVEILLLHTIDATQEQGHTWEAFVRGSHLRAGMNLTIADNFTLTLGDRLSDRARAVHYNGSAQECMERIHEHGHTPIPPYMADTPIAEDALREKYQTIFSQHAGSIAAPTAGLHFTPALLDAVREMGVQTTFVTLHVGAGTFTPITTENVYDHHMHSEYATLSPETAAAVNAAKQEGRRVIAVGTTSVRTLESFARNGRVSAGSHWTDIYIRPGYHFDIVDGMITNFHTPRSTLLVLVSAFAGKQVITTAYQEAIAHNYRFYSFGDAMLIV